MPNNAFYNNLLFTSAGRRSYLIKYFRKELTGKGLVHVANSGRLCTAFLEADKTVITPLIYDDSYIKFILNYCYYHKIKAIIPLFDIDIPVLASHDDEFSKFGVSLVCSPAHVAITCNDKWQSYLFLRKNGLYAPKSINSLDKAQQALHTGEIEFPVIIKPRWGMGSIGIYQADNKAELELLYQKTFRDIEKSYLRYESKSYIKEAVIIQEKLNGQEYGLDVVNDLAGNYVTTFVKKKLAMRAGETDAAVSVSSDILSELGYKLSMALGHHANLDVDVFLIDNKPYILEMNARFGGGYPFSHLAGANLPKAILSWLNGKPADPSCFEIREGVISMKNIEPRAYDISYA
ncbi:MAG: ATP-grasp domain-containing protein [bacterium]